MSIHDRQRWDEKHRAAAALTARASVLALPAATPRDALALDLACGQGRHCVALARAGYRVVAMDVSMQALRHLPAAAVQGGGEPMPVQADADAWPFAVNSFDLVVQVDFLDRRLFEAIRSSLRDGGLLLIDTFLDQGCRNADGPSNPDFLLVPGELPRTFADFDVLRDEETRGETARALLLARKRVDIPQVVL